jgi:hypothetical protein
MNPWVTLPAQSPLVLPLDLEAVDRFNAAARPQHLLHLDIVPEPFLGNPNGPVVLLGLNPGFTQGDDAVHLDPRFNAAARANLEHRHPNWPFYLLDPSLPSPGQRWWKQRLRALIEVVGLSAVASHVFVAEIHGYHSSRYSHRLRVPSQDYTRSLILGALHRDAQIVILRGRRYWFAMIPELMSSQRVALVRNVQNPVISPANCGDTFGVIVSAIESAA